MRQEITYICQTSSNGKVQYVDERNIFLQVFYLKNFQTHRKSERTEPEHP